MNFQDLVTVGDHKFYLDIAFKKAKKQADESRSSVKKVDRLHKARIIEQKKIESIRDAIDNSLSKIESSFPSMDSLPEFYKELCELHFSVKEVKKAIAAMRWASDKIRDLSKATLANIRKQEDIEKINGIRRAYYGRVSSVMKQINKQLLLLEETRRTMKGFPAIKEKLFTISIVGFPNVGKSTLITQLTFSDVPVNSYAFTTKRLLVGYARVRHEKIQFIDTPGTLARDDKMNYVERLADLAIKYVADTLVYVFDPTEQYPMLKQEKLLKNIKKFGKPVILYVSKTDIADPDIVEEIREKYPEILTNQEDLKNEIEKEFLKY